MFNIVAMVFLMVNGAPSEQPARVLTYNQTFETLEACLAFSKTDEGLAMRQAVNEYVMTQRGAIVVKLGCAKADDNTI